MQRRCRVDDHERVSTIERASGALFRSIGMAAVADDPPISSLDFERFVVDRGAFAWMIDGKLVAYMLLEQVDDAAHIEQVTVHPENARQGIGAHLIAVADSWAGERHLSRVTLTTFRDVPWNAPYYARLGFRIFPQRLWGPKMETRMDVEGARGLNAWPRVAMVRAASR